MTEIGAGIRIKVPAKGAFAEILTPEAVEFVAGLHRRFNPCREELLAARAERQMRFDAGERPDFLAETKQIRESEWTVAPPPQDLLDRRVEITGPPDRRTIVNALNSGAKAFVADFEDSTSPTWENLLEGQIHLRDAVRRTIDFEDEDSGTSYKLEEGTTALQVCPRGWHREERHVLIDEVPISASLFDFGLYLFHNANELLLRGTGPYFCLPKMESYLEARLWNEIFVAAQQQLDVPGGSIKATVLMETVGALLEADEILWELRDHVTGLKDSRWNYIFSYIKNFAGDEAINLPDREQLTAATHLISSYSRLCIKTCHRRGVHAIGGTSALIPCTSDPETLERVMKDLLAEKEREVIDGHDGTGVTHPELVPVVMNVFNQPMPSPDRIDGQLSEFNPSAADVLQPPDGVVTEAGMRQNVAAGLGYVEAWLLGAGRVPLSNSMVDAAMAEVSRAQLWQWIHHHAALIDGRKVTMEWVEEIIKHELASVKPVVGMERYRAYMRAAEWLREVLRSETFTEFLTSDLYPRVLEREHYPMS